MMAELNMLYSIGELEKKGAIVAIQDGNHGEKHPISDDYVESGIPFIMAKDIRDGILDLKGCKFLKKEKADSLRIGFAKPGDVLLTHKGTVGNVAIIPYVENYVMLTPQVTYYRLNPMKMDKRYFFYALCEPGFQDRLVSISSQSTRPYVGITAQRGLKVLCYPLHVQRKITAILSAYDDLIENNLRRIKILEEMTQNLYREWFFNFRFPGHEQTRFVDSTLGRIPEGWEVRILKDTCNLVMGQSPKSEFYNDIGLGLPFHQGVTNFGSRFPLTKHYCTVTKRIAQKGDILFSVRAPVGRINISDSRLVIGRGLSAISHKRGWQWFLYHYLRDVFKDEDIIGGGTIYKSVTKKDMEDIKILNPQYDTVDYFESIVRPINNLIEALDKKNNSLRQTRDLLLPKLITGEIDVSELDINTTGEQAI